MVAFPHFLGEHGRMKQSMLHVLVTKSIKDRSKGDRNLKKICNTRAMRMLIEYKWDSYANKLLWINIIAFGSTAVLFFHIALSLDKKDDEMDNLTLLEYYALMVIMGIYLLGELKEMAGLSISAGSAYVGWAQHRKYT